MKILPAFLGAFLLVVSVGYCSDEAVIDMEAIKMIESSLDANAYNRLSEARGWFQITPICLLDYNVQNKASYKPSELFDPQINSKVAYWYMNERIPQLLKAHGVPDSVDNRLIAFNCGVGCVGKPLPSETKHYLVKYRELAF